MPEVASETPGIKESCMPRQCSQHASTLWPFSQGLRAIQTDHHRGLEPLVVLLQRRVSVSGLGRLLPTTQAHRCCLCIAGPRLGVCALLALAAVSNCSSR